ncbi:MAG: RluA family pseudouridine synthase [Minisyncoccia bacterium]
MNIEILLETNDVLVFNKPSGIMVHPDGKDRTEKKPVLTDWIIEQYPSIVGVGEPMLVNEESIDRPGIVHRLDEETSGALIIAKHQESFLSLKAQFKDRVIKKEYHAFVWGHFKDPSGSVDAPIGRNKNDFRRWQAGRGIRGEEREAVTHFQAQTQFEDESGERFSLMHLYPLTGRTHQLRVHMQYLQRPIVADSLYAPAKPKALGFERVALHARKISFLDLQGKLVSVEAPYPVDFEAAIAKYCSS